MMKNVAKLVVTLVITAAFASCSQAQTPTRSERSPEERAQMQTEIMTEALSLNEAQVPPVDDINRKYSRLMTDLQAQDGNRRSKFRAARELMSEKDTELQAVLTEDQYAVYQEKKAEMRDKLKEKRREQRN